MLDLFDEFRALIGALEADGVDYAVCGGLAMAIHALPRATIDIDLLVRTEDLPVVMRIAKDLGYGFEAEPMRFRRGEVEIRRVSKIDPDSGDTLTLDLLLVMPATTDAWETRQAIAWEGGTVRVVSRDGLIALKSLRKSGQDLDDIALLRDDDES
ncbi:MAG: hypothetical protein H0T89_18670 [Deltaproteobacteria bacterium]|nr:hypothetical protein [Deltaproteobacteria bacterium]MDQ3296297.1 nucleotidyltransferase family protein [Myxococcota bacterium]